MIGLHQFIGSKLIYFDKLLPIYRFKNRVDIFSIFLPFDNQYSITFRDCQISDISMKYHIIDKNRFFNLWLNIVAINEQLLHLTLFGVVELHYLHYWHLTSVLSIWCRWVALLALLALNIITYYLVSLSCTTCIIRKIEATKVFFDTALKKKKRKKEGKKKGVHGMWVDT